MLLTDNQVDIINEYINRSSINIQTLKDDLLDHFCCVTEINIDKGLSFDDAFEKAKLITAPEGLNEIQGETIFLLNYNKILLMKRLAYISGFIFTLAWFMGTYFKIMQLFLVYFS